MILIYWALFLSLFVATITHAAPISPGPAKIAGPAPTLTLRETDQSLPAGLWRFYLNANTLTLQRNTAAGGDFSTTAQPLQVGTARPLKVYGETVWSDSDDVTVRTISPAAGFQKLPSGLFLSWQQFTSTTDDNQTVTMTYTAPTGFFFCSANWVTELPAADVEMIPVKGFTGSNVIVNRSNGIDVNTYTAAVFCLGY